MKLLFVSNLFPDTAEPYRGLDNATLLHHLADRWEIRVLAVRPSLEVGDVMRMMRAGWSRIEGSGGHRPPLQRWVSRGEDAPFKPEYVPCPYVPKVGSRWNHRLMARALRGEFRRIREEFPFDVVLSSWMFPDSCAVAELAEELGFPFVAIAQGSDVHQYLEMPVRREIMTRLLPRASAVITRSAELARRLAEAGLPRERLHPIYNGVDLEQFRPAEKVAVRRELGLPIDADLILFVGNFYKIKNPFLPPLALHLIAPHSFPTPPVLVMLGGGGLAERIRQCADRISVGNRVFLPGRTDAKGVARYMQAADVLLLTSKDEGVPNVILEAFASGLPVVASRVGGIPEIHPGDDFGRLVSKIEPGPFAAALKEVLQSRPPMERIRKHALQFSWHRTAEACHALLTEACR